MKKYLSAALVALMLHAFAHAPLASETPRERAKKALRASEIKAGVADLGTGAKARVRVVLADKTSYNGYVTEIAADHFVVADAKTGATAPIAYTEVTGIRGNNLSTGAKIAIGAAVTAAVVAIIVALTRDDDDEIRGGEPPCLTVPCP